MPNTYPENWSDIDKALYNRSVRVFNTVKKVLGVKMKLHADTQVQQGDIFLFNHFSRFETFIPQFLIYEQTGAYSCAIASHEFFKTTPCWPGTCSGSGFSLTTMTVYFHC